MWTTTNPLALKDYATTKETTQLLLPDGRILWARYDTNEDWNYYSKSYHKTHGPKRTYENRCVVFLNPDGRQGETVLKVESWRGNWQKKAIIAAGFTEEEYTAMICAARLLAT